MHNMLQYNALCNVLICQSKCIELYCPTLCYSITLYWYIVTDLTGSTGERVVHVTLNESLDLGELNWVFFLGFQMQSHTGGYEWFVRCVRVSVKLSSLSPASHHWCPNRNLNSCWPVGGANLLERASNDCLKSLTIPHSNWAWPAGRRAVFLGNPHWIGILLRVTDPPCKIFSYRVRPKHLNLQKGSGDSLVNSEELCSRGIWCLKNKELQV